MPSPKSILSPKVLVSLFTGCQDRPYAFGMATALVSKSISVNVIGSSDLESPEMHRIAGLRFLNLWGKQPDPKSLPSKLKAVFLYYFRIIRYAKSTNSDIFHILWNGKLQMLDRTALMLYYKLLGKRIALTAHNINQNKRDGNDNLINRLTLKFQYKVVDHIFVHTQKMKNELMYDFDIHDSKITVIRHPLNNAFPETSLTPSEAKRRIGIRESEKAILFFGRISPYKGLEYLLDAVEILLNKQSDFRLIIAGNPKKGNDNYVDIIRKRSSSGTLGRSTILRMEFIPDEDVEMFLKAADVLVLPYKDIFQSGVLFLSYSFGLPVIATDVGSFREEIVEAETGYICRPADSKNMAEILERYFDGPLYRELISKRAQLRDYTRRHHSWDAVGDLTVKAYNQIRGGSSC